MTSIGGPGGIGGPKGPGGPDAPDGPEGPEAADAAERPDAADRAGDVAALRGGAVDQLAAEVAAGRLTPREAVDQLVELTAGPELDPAARAELRELLTDLVANDPYLGGLLGRV